MTFRLDYNKDLGVLQIFECPMLFSAGKPVLFTSRQSNGDRLVVRIPSLKSFKVLRNGLWDDFVVCGWWSVSGESREFRRSEFVQAWQVVVGRYRVSRFNKDLLDSLVAEEVLSLFEGVDFGP